MRPKSGNKRRNQWGRWNWRGIKGTVQGYTQKIGTLKKSERDYGWERIEKKENHWSSIIIKKKTAIRIVKKGSFKSILIIKSKITKKNINKAKDIKKKELT